DLPRVRDYERNQADEHGDGQSGVEVEESAPRLSPETLPAGLGDGFSGRARKVRLVWALPVLGRLDRGLARFHRPGYSLRRLGSWHVLLLVHCHVSTRAHLATRQEFSPSHISAQPQPA